MCNYHWLARLLAAVTLFGWFFSAKAQAPQPVDSDNPPVTSCNVTPDTVPDPSDPNNPNKRIATPIEAKLLTSGQPCRQVVGTKGLIANNDLANLQRGFDFYSWLTFLALNSPADGKPIGQGPRPNGDATTKWEVLTNYRPLADVMMTDGSKPTWGERIVPELCKKSDGPDKIVLKLGEASWNQPFRTGPLIDQSGNYAIFDILMNKPMFDFINNKGLFSVQGQESYDKDVEFPAGVNPSDKDSTPGKMGAVMLKVSWRILDPNKDKALLTKFHTADALIYFPGPPTTKAGPACVEKKLGLIGFHVGHKTEFAPQWVWTSFEHVSNAPNEKELDSLHPPYNFFSPSCQQRCSKNSPSCQQQCLKNQNQTPPDPWDPPVSLKFHSDFKSQVVRAKILPDNLANEVDDLNQKFRALLKGTIWENYVLLTTQWPSDHESKIDCNGAPAPTYLANTTLETYSQGRVPLASSSCMACHGNATTQHVPATASDFTFILEKAQCENGICGPIPATSQPGQARRCGLAVPAPH